MGVHAEGRAWESLDSATKRAFRRRVIERLAAGATRPQAQDDAAEQWGLRKSLSLRDEVGRLAKWLEKITS